MIYRLTRSQWQSFDGLKLKRTAGYFKGKFFFFSVEKFEQEAISVFPGHGTPLSGGFHSDAQSHSTAVFVFWR